MEISIRELKILKKYFSELNLKIQAPWRPGALYLSTPAHGLIEVLSLHLRGGNRGGCQSLTETGEGSGSSLCVFALHGKNQLIAVRC
jgi:hypothetical protein